MSLIVVDSLSERHRPTWVEIHLGHLVHNFRAIRARVGTGVKICAVVKAEAYGHGAVAVARCLEEVGADWFGVATVEEGVALRAAGIARPILCFGVLQGQQDLVLEYRLTPVVFDLSLAERLEACARARHTILDVHLEVDTGMGRVGVPLRELTGVLRALARFPHLRLDGLMTHLAAADDPAKAEFTREQIARFRQALQVVEAMGFHPTYRHLANSAGVRAYPEAWGNMVRPGGLLYGLWSGPQVSELVLDTLEGDRVLRPVLSLHTRIAFLKDVDAGTPLGYGSAFVTSRPSRIATLPIGYHDGYRRALSRCGHSARSEGAPRDLTRASEGALPKDPVCGETSTGGRVLVRGQFASVVGRVSMDWTLVDVTDIPEVRVGDEVILIGQANGQRILAEDVAAWCGTISYEITSGISGRVPRVIIPAAPAQGDAGRREVSE